MTANSTTSAVDDRIETEFAYDGASNLLVSPFPTESISGVSARSGADPGPVISHAVP